MPEHQAIHEELIRLSQVVEGNPVATIVIDARHRVAYWNRACAVLTGVAADSMIGTTDQWRAFYGAPRPIMADLIVNGALERDVDTFYHGKFHRSALIDGAFEAEDFFPAFGEGGRWLFFTAAPIRDEAGQVVGAVETLQDVTARKRAEASLRDKEVFLGQVIEGSSVATLVIDVDHRVTHWNRACELLTGVPAAEVIGTRQQWRPFYGAERPVMADLVLDSAGDQTVNRLYHGRYRPSPVIPGSYEAEDFFPHLGAEGRWLFFTAAPIRDSEGRAIGAIETLQDVTQRRQVEEALKESESRFRQLSLTDALTGLYNSRYLHERLQAEIDRAQRYGRPLSLIALDCDNFKRVNDTHGHPVGDRVLQELAAAIRDSLRRTDSAYRYGGEEFVALLPEAHGLAAELLAERLRSAFAGRVVHPEPGVALQCTVSIGVAEFRAGETAAMLLRRADDACYEAKRRGKNCVVLAG